jgi:hypothetical protein
MKIIKLTAVIFLCAILASCTKVIDLKLNNSSSQLVIEGNLTDQPGVQTVTLSKSVPFDSTNTFLAVSGATVKIIDNSSINNPTRTLAETSPGTYMVNSYSGKYNHSYTLQVLLNGQTYTATSTMPNLVRLDSISVNNQSFGNKVTKTIAAYYEDPPGVPNQYRLILYVNHVQVNQVFVRNDQFGDGRQVQALLYQDNITIKAGDQIDVDMQCIDPAIYLYWYTLSQEEGDGFNNSATPTNPPNNFNTNVLGYFSAHTIQRKTIIAY